MSKRKRDVIDETSLGDVDTIVYIQGRCISPIGEVK